MHHNILDFLVLLRTCMHVVKHFPQGRYCADDRLKIGELNVRKILKIMEFHCPFQNFYEERIEIGTNICGFSFVICEIGFENEEF